MMEVIVNIFCFVFGLLLGIAVRGEFTINYNKTYKDDTTHLIPVKELEPNNKPEENVDSPAEIAEKIQEALGVFINDEQN